MIFLNNQIVVELGEGNVAVTGGCNSDDGSMVIGFQNARKGEVGRKLPKDEYQLDESSVILYFKSAEDVDRLIDTLNRLKNFSLSNGGREVEQ